MNKKWLYRNARPLEQALYKYHFEDNSKDEVLEILKTYQNSDGGFGYGLEPDCHNPHSSPMQTWTAICIIRELDLKEHTIIESILKYLETTEDQKNGHYPFTIPSNDEYPHASWWHYSDRAYEDYNPTASLQGFVLRYGKNTPIYQQALITATEIIDHVILQGSQEMHELTCIIELMNDIEIAGLEGLFRYKTFKEKVIESVHHLIEKDSSKWGDYTCTPLKFIQSKSSIFYKGLEELTHINIEQLKERMNPNGYWDINWAWDNYQEDFILARQWWRGIITINNLKILDAFKKV